MPRVGRHPLKQKKIIEQQVEPRSITITTIVYIPSLEGYWQDSLNVLKIFFDTLIKNTDEEFDLMVFDNGSCQKVISFLIDLKNDGIIQFLILSSKNLKKLGALDYLLRSATGDLISYSDSDVLFLPGWLTESKKILDNFPEAAKVTAIPIAGGDTTKISEESYLEAEKDRTIKIKTGKIIPDKLIEAHSLSIGKTMEQFNNDHLDRIDTLLIRGKYQAFLSTADFQFTLRKNALKNILPLKIEHESDYYDPIYSPILEKKLNQFGWWQLSLNQYLIHHMGNSVPDLDSEIPWLNNENISAQSNNNEHNTLKKLSIFNSTRIRTLLKKINTWTYKKLYEK